MTLQDFAQGKGWVGISSSRLLCPDTGVCMLRAEVGSVRVGAGCQGEPEWENEGKRDLGWGERRPLFYLCLGSLSQVRCSKRGKWRSSLSTPSPSLPGLRLTRLGTESRSTGSDRSAVGWSSSGSGEKFREL